MGGYLYFTASEPLHGSELWRSDGTAAGTVLVKDFIPGPASGVTDFASIGERLYFAVRDATHGNELWTSDGTAGGSVLVRDINPGSPDSNPAFFRNAAGRAVFLASALNRGPAVWVSSGTLQSTTFVVDVNADQASSSPGESVALGGSMYFAIADPCGLWKSSGTADSTSPVRSVSPCPETVRNLRVANGLLFFDAAPDGDQSSRGLWRTDGSSRGAILLRKGLPPASDFTNLNGTLFFRIALPANSSFQYGLWKTDGSSVGTLPVLIPVKPLSLTGYQGAIYFTDASALWRSDGTQLGTIKIKDVEAGQLVHSGSLLYFSRMLSGNSYELWRTDGTAPGTYSIGSFAQAATDGPRNLVDVNGNLYFTVQDSSHYALWTSSGTAARPVKEFPKQTSICPCQDPSGLISVNGMLLFSADDGLHGRELWRSDGTAAGTQMVRDIYPGPVGSEVAQMTSFGRFALFSASDGFFGQELWRTDGTAAGTVRLTDIAYGPRSSFPTLFTVAGQSVLFFADDGLHGLELWGIDPLP